MDKVTRKIVLENARIMFRNFSGKPDRFNPQGGKRSFHVLLPADLAEEMQDEGWNVKWFTPKEPDDIPDAHIQVSFSYDNYPPKIFRISGKKKTLLDEDTVDVLDNAEFENVDLVIRPYNWETATGSGVKAYVESMYVTIVQDAFAKKYEEFDDGEDPDKLPF